MDRLVSEENFRYILKPCGGSVDLALNQGSSTPAKELRAMLAHPRAGMTTVMEQVAALVGGNDGNGSPT